jgi:nitroreductase
MVELSDVLGSQRACRDFSDDPIDDVLVEQLLTLAGHAPSAYNSQPWEWVVVRDPSARTELAAITESVWVNGAREWAEGALSNGMRRDVEHGATVGMAGAPVVVVVCGDTTRCLPGAMSASIFPAVQSLLLAATDAGLGSALTTLATHDPRLAELLGLPDHVRALAVVPLGWPTRPLGPPRRDPVAQHLHLNRY